MKKLLLLCAFAATGIISFGQTTYGDIRTQLRLLQDKPMVLPNSTPVYHNVRQNNTSKSLRSQRSLLNSQRIGSAGNLLTIIEGVCNQMDVIDSLNAVMFIHRNDDVLFAGTNVSQYRIDQSTDRGNTWTSNIGPLSTDPLIGNTTGPDYYFGRFPQAVLWNPAGNNTASNVKVVYNGTYHNDNGSNTGSWAGQIVGRGDLSGNAAVFNDHLNEINGGHTSIAGGMCKGIPGTFWAINQDFSGTFASNDQITNGLIVEKGVWNSGSGDVDWTETTIPVTFAQYDASGQGTYNGTAATSFNIAFDPSGRYGWISCLGDVTQDADSVYDPIFWKSVDSGATWTGPIHVDLNDIQGVVSAMNPNLSLNVTGGSIEPATLNPTTAFEADLSVDANGNPHLLTTVGSGTEYSIQDAGYDVWDITYNSNNQSGCQWYGIHLAKINTLRGTFSSDAPQQTEDNRPLISRSPDGNKLFFFWNESDANFLGSDNNDVPNLFGRGVDVASGKMTQLYNFTGGDSLWGGQTETLLGGVFGGSIFPEVSQTCLVNGGNYNIPIVFTQVDYNNISGGLGSSVNPAAFWYVNNMNVPASDFTSPIDQVAPTITLNGMDTVYVHVNTAYADSGATAFDCFDGSITPTVVNVPDTSQLGVYYEMYIATDAAGNSDTVTRVVFVGDIPSADFNFTPTSQANRIQFFDASSNYPTTWTWDFGYQGNGSSLQNPIFTFPAINDYNVCLTASNVFGTSAQKCRTVSITSLGTAINDVDLDASIKVSPNPTSGVVNLTFTSNATPNFTVSVYNVLGQEVIGANNYHAGTTNVSLDLSSFNAGAYFVKIQSNAGTVVKNIVLTHSK
ncbi:MAG TPA: T9SS type A sorting domain-containing protein [Chitinophagales bacterium]|nr:T9SS type A sorting domain-containing protein [Chitinophagales bacterium]